MNSSIAIVARREARAYPGSVEAGKEVAMSLFLNHVCLSIARTFSALTFVVIQTKSQKCLTCHNSGRGANRPKHAQPPKGQQGNDLLSCGCPVSTSLLELVMTKTVPTRHPEYPSRPKLDASQVGYKAADYTYPHSTFAFNPITLGLVERFIFELTEQKAEDLLCQPQVRLIRVIAGASGHLIKEYREAREANADGEQYEEEWKTILAFRATVDKFSRKMAELQRKNGLPGGSVHYDEC